MVLGKLRIALEPTYQQLEAATISLAQDLGRSLSVLPRLTTVLLKSNELLEYSAAVAADKDCVKQIQLIAHGLQANQPLIEEYIKKWEVKYHDIWEINKVKFIERYSNSNPPLSKFDADIARYAEVTNNVQREDTITSINFIMLDCSSLKFAIIEHCNEWQNRFTTLLLEMSSKKLNVSNLICI